MFASPLLGPTRNERRLRRREVYLSRGDSLASYQAGGRPVLLRDVCITPPREGQGEASNKIMLNYVNNSFDKTLKPCDLQMFNILTQGEQTEKLILGHRAGEPKAKGKLPAITYMGVLDEAKYKAYLRQCEEQGGKPLGSRRAEFMRPTGLFMLDFDHVAGRSPLPEASPVPSRGGVTQASLPIIDSPVKLWEYIQEKYSAMSASSPSGGVEGACLPAMSASSPSGGVEGALALAHITPSGDGLRVVVKRTKGVTIEQEQHAWCQAMNLDAVGVKVDAVCKDISRLSFVPMAKEILYFNPSLLFAELPEASDYPDGSLFNPSLATAEQGEAVAPVVVPNPATFDTEYRGIPYKEIVKRLEAQLGGAPERGARNSFIFSMACNLRYICNDNVDWVASILPTYGEEPQKHRVTIQSAINRPMSKSMPETLARALKVEEGVKQLAQAMHSTTPPDMPGTLPEPIYLLTSRTPERMQAAVAMAVFPPLGAHVCGTRFTYWDGRDYEPTFMNVVVAELSAGKSAVNTPIEYIIADMEARDEVAREKERQWREKCALIKNPDDRPERPKGLVRQVLSADMTNAAFVQRLADADGHFLYTQMDEIELLNALKTNTSGTVTAVLRLAFDCGKYGQERVAANAIDMKAQVRWNWNASSTVQRVRKFFARSIADGTLSRLSFATIVRKEGDYGRERPKYGQYGKAFADELRPYIDALCGVSGTIVCPEAQEWASALCDELSDFAEECEDDTYAQFSFRAVLMGFFRAMLLYVMNGCRWSQVIADFAAWTVRYDMWCKMRFFSDMVHKDLAGEKTSLQVGPVSLLTLLPDEFTREDVRNLRIAQGMKPDPTNMIKTWKNRGQVQQSDERCVYTKIKGVQGTGYN